MPDKFFGDILFRSLRVLDLPLETAEDLHCAYSFIHQHRRSLRELWIDLYPREGWSDVQPPTRSLGTFPNLVKYTGGIELIDTLLVGSSLAEIDLHLSQNTYTEQQLSCLSKLPLKGVKTFSYARNIDALRNVLQHLSLESLVYLCHRVEIDDDSVDDHEAHMIIMVSVFLHATSYR